ncbi:hypothetical protein KC19_5G104900, partial [Ceratodon purpureus]
MLPSSLRPVLTLVMMESFLGRLYCNIDVFRGCSRNRTLSSITLQPVRSTSPASTRKPFQAPRRRLLTDRFPQTKLSSPTLPTISATQLNKPTPQI